MSIKKKKSQGHIYILSNPCFPYLKIGYTTNSPLERCKQLSRATAIPKPFDLEYSCIITNCSRVEQRLHDILKRYKFNKEFFDVSVNEAREIIHYNFIAVDKEKYTSRAIKKALEERRAA